MTTVDISDNRPQLRRAPARAGRPARSRRPGRRDLPRELVDELEYRLLHGKPIALLLTPLVLPLRGRACPSPAQLLSRLRTRLGLRPELSRSLAPVPLRLPPRRKHA